MRTTELSDTTTPTAWVSRVMEAAATCRLPSPSGNSIRLEEALETARTLTQGRVIAIFGSAGLRDEKKRWLMSETSIELADMTVLTAEDPRTESLDEILEQMAEGARSRGGVEGETFIRVPDRGQAIRKALDLAKPGDLVVSCGKGHEQSMCFGTKEYDWDDRTAMRAALADGQPTASATSRPPASGSHAIAGILGGVIPLGPRVHGGALHRRGQHEPDPRGGPAGGKGGQAQLDLADRDRIVARVRQRHPEEEAVRADQGDGRDAGADGGGHGGEAGKAD